MSGRRVRTRDSANPCRKDGLEDEGARARIASVSFDVAACGKVPKLALAAGAASPRVGRQSELRFRDP